MSRRQAALCLAAGLLLVVAAPLVRAGLAPDPAGETVTNLNVAGAEALAAPDPTGSAVAPSSTSSTFTASAAASVESVEPTAPASPTATAPAETAPAEIAPTETTAAAPAATTPPPAAAAPAPTAPARLQVPALGIDSPVIPVGVAASGDLEIPADVQDIGWYRFGPAPGADTGSAVLTGHVDSRKQGPGPFSRLGELAEGDAITVVDDTGAARTFTVLSREEWPKSEVPVDRIFDRGGSARLVLITCGGDFDASTGHYEDNVAVTAVPAAGGSG